MPENHKELEDANQHLSTANYDLIREVIEKEKQKLTLVQANEQLVNQVVQKEKQKINLIQFGTTIGTALTLTAISWLVASTYGNSEKLARIDERLNIISMDRYTASDAAKDFKITNTRIDGIETRLNRSINRVERLEQTLIEENLRSQEDKN